MSEDESIALKNTKAVHDLCAAPRDKRDDAWRSAFLSHIPAAGMAGGDPQVTSGPDGFPYFNLFLPPQGKPFEPFSIQHLLPFACEHGFGAAVLVSSPEQPDWVFSFGDLWSYKETGEFYHDPPRWGAPPGQAEEAASLQPGVPVLIAQPNQDFLPDYVRSAIAKVLRSSFGIAEPQVFLLSEDSLSPSTNLVFNIFNEDFDDENRYDFVKMFLAWSLPRDYGMVEIPKDSELIENFSPL